MDLAGQCSNQAVKASWEQLAPVLVRLREGPGHERPEPRARQIRRPGQILNLVVAILLQAEGPMRGYEVRDEAIRWLGEDISFSTVRNALVEADRRASLPVTKIGWGLYEGKA